MEPSEFVRRWKDYVARTDDPDEECNKLPAPDSRLSAKTSRFLVEAGLPDGVYLRFPDLADGLKPLCEVVGKPGDWSEDDHNRLDRYLVLGDDAGGNPICLDLADQEHVVFLDHEADFRVSAINSGVAELAECILLYQEMVESYQNEAGEEAELYEGNVPVLLVQTTLEKMRQADPALATDNGLWPGALEDI